MDTTTTTTTTTLGRMRISSLCIRSDRMHRSDENKTEAIVIVIVVVVVVV